MVNKAVPPEDLEKVTWELAKKIAGNYPLEIRSRKQRVGLLELLTKTISYVCYLARR